MEVQGGAGGAERCRQVHAEGCREVLDKLVNYIVHCKAL